METLVRFYLNEEWEVVTVIANKYKDPKEYKKALKEIKERRKKMKYFSDYIRLFKDKINQPILYPTDTLWQQLIALSCGIYYDGFWEEFKKDIIDLNRRIAFRN